jgi:uncharacterized protein
MDMTRIKDKIGKIIRKKPGTKTAASKVAKEKTGSTSRSRRKSDSSAIKEEFSPQILGTQEMVVEKSKFSTPSPSRMRRVMPHDLPYGYGRDRIVLQTRDPWWLHTYWEVIHQTYEHLKARLGDSFYSAKKVLRVYDVTNIIFNGSNANRHFDIEIAHDATSWYIDTGNPGRSWCVDYGLRLSNGEFITIVRSNTAYTPLDGPSWITDEEWMVPEELFARLYGMGFGLGQSSPVGKAWAERIKRELFSGVLASPGMASAASPVKAQRIPKDRKFWLIVNTELIVYGATEPDAKVTVQGKEIKLRPDGTFTLRYALPDGKQVIPVNAVSADGIDDRTITPIVTRETK